MSSAEARRLLEAITEELTAWAEPATPCWTWHDGGEEKALAAIEEALFEARFPQPAGTEADSEADSRQQTARREEADSRRQTARREEADSRRQTAGELERHFEDDEFPEHCDHCPRSLEAGQRYRRCLFVMDATDSVVGGERNVVEHSYELVLCPTCAERLSAWVRTPLEEVAADWDAADGLDDASLAEELEKEAFILGKDPPIEPDLSRCVRHDCPRDGDCPVHGKNRPGQCVPSHPGNAPKSGDEANRVWQEHFEHLRPSESKASPCLDPEKMLGFCDQFGGTDDPEDR